VEGTRIKHFEKKKMEEKCENVVICKYGNSCRNKPFHL